jgi:general stress protein 26
MRKNIKRSGSAMDDETIHRANRELMASTEAVYLTTVDQEGYPHTRAMLNLRNKHLYPSQARFCVAHGKRPVVYFTTNTSSQKVAHVRVNPRVSAYYCSPADFHGVMIGGAMEIIDDIEIKHALWDPGWIQYYPEGPEDPDHTLLRLTPKLVRGWNRGVKFEFEL